jgi:hypothetical protein
VTLEFSKVDEYNKAEKLRDPSHARAFTFNELRSMIEKSRLVNLESKCQNLEMELDKLLEVSFPNHGDKEKFHVLFKEDVQKDTLDMKSFLKENDNKIYFYFPISMLLPYKK